MISPAQNALQIETRRAGALSLPTVRKILEDAWTPGPYAAIVRHRCRTVHVLMPVARQRSFVAPARSAAAITQPPPGTARDRPVSSIALRSKVTIKNGRIQQSNFDTFPIPRMPEVPPLEVALLPSIERPGGMGEVGVPLVAPSIGNALFALTGRRIRALPLEDAGISFA